MIHDPIGNAITLEWKLSNSGVGRWFVKNGDSQAFVAWSQNNIEGAKEALTKYVEYKAWGATNAWQLGYLTRSGVYAGFIAVEVKGSK